MGWGVISDSSTAFMFVFSFGSNIPFEDARLALGLVLILRCAGLSPLFRCHPILDLFFAVCPDYLDSLFDVETQTPAASSVSTGL